MSEHEHESLKDRVSEALDRVQAGLDDLSRDPADASGVAAEAERHREAAGEPDAEATPAS